MTHRVCDRDDTSAVLTHKYFGTCQILSLHPEFVIWGIVGVVCLFIILHRVNASWIRAELHLRDGHKFVQLPVELAHGFISFNWGHSTFVSEYLGGARDGSSFREDRLGFELLSDHKNVHFIFSCRPVKVLYIVDDSILRHLITSFRPSKLPSSSRPCWAPNTWMVWSFGTEAYRDSIRASWTFIPLACLLTPSICVLLINDSLSQTTLCRGSLRVNTASQATLSWTTFFFRPNPINSLLLTYGFGECLLEHGCLKIFFLGILDFLAQ